MANDFEAQFEAGKRELLEGVQARDNAARQNAEVRTRYENHWRDNLKAIIDAALADAPFGDAGTATIKPRGLVTEMLYERDGPRFSVRAYSAIGIGQHAHVIIPEEAWPEAIPQFNSFEKAEVQRRRPNAAAQDSTSARLPLLLSVGATDVKPRVSGLLWYSVTKNGLPTPTSIQSSEVKTELLRLVKLLGAHPIT